MKSKSKSSGTEQKTLWADWTTRLSSCDFVGCFGLLRRHFMQNCNRSPHIVKHANANANWLRVRSSCHETQWAAQGNCQRNTNVSQRGGGADWFNQARAHLSLNNLLSNMHQTQHKMYSTRRDYDLAGSQTAQVIPLQRIWKCDLDDFIEDHRSMDRVHLIAK